MVEVIYSSLPVLVSPPESPVLSLEDVKPHARVEEDNQDDLIEAYVQAATDMFDGQYGLLRRCLVTQTWRLDLSGFAAVMRLPFAPVQNVTVTYLDNDGVEQTASDDLYDVLEDAIGPMVALKSGASWPDTDNAHDAVRLQFVAGYGAPSDVPEAIRQAIRLLVSHWIDAREAVVIGNGISVEELPFGVRCLLRPYRRWGA